MKTNNKIKFLIENGLSSKTVSVMTESQINLLFEKFKKMKKEENNEQVQQQQTTKTIVGPKGGNIPVKPGQTTVSLKPVPNAQPGTVEVVEKELSEDETDDVTSSNAQGDVELQKYTGQEAPHMANDMAPDGMDDDSDNNRSNMGMAESEITEKFESKAQQGLFWARCNKCSDKKCKWCKMAKEFSDSTSKKQYKNMPEKKHPEKTVKSKKKETKEQFEKFLEKKISEMVDNNISPKMTKKDIIETVKKKSKKMKSMIIRRPKKVTMFSAEAPMELPIGKMFSIGKK
jgi:hypothetical protein